MSIEAKRAQLRILQKKAQLQQLQAQVGSKPAPMDKVTDEMPEWLSDADRLKVQNLTNSDDQKVAFLQQQYPDAEVKKSGDRILLRKKGESDYGVLDPSFSMGRILSKEGLRDLGDVASDIGQGASEAVGAAAGAASGFLAGAGAGALPGVMIGSGVASGAYSDARERLAEMLNVKKYDGAKVAQDAAWGAAIPGVFTAAGAGAKAVAKKAIPKTYSWATGVSEPMLKRIAKDGDVISAKSSDQALQGVEGLQKTFKENIGERLDELSTRYDGIGDGSIDLKPVFNEIDGDIAKLQQLVNENPGSGSFKKELAEAIKFRQSEMAPNGMQYKKMKISASQKLRNSLADRYLPSYKQDIGQGIGKGVSEVEEKYARKVRDLLSEQTNVATGGVKGQIDSEYTKLNRVADFGRKYLGTPEKTMTTIKKLIEGTDDVMLGNFQRLPKEIQDDIMKLREEKQIYDYFKGINKNRVVTDDSLGGKAIDAALGSTPLEKMLSVGGGVVGKLTTGNMYGGAAGYATGKAVGKKLTSPETVLKTAKMGAKAGGKLESLEKLLKENPKLLQMLYGGAATERD